MDSSLIMMYFMQVGGFDGSTGLKSAERYDPATQEWRPIASMSTRRSSVGVGVLNGLLYAVNWDEENQCGKERIFQFVFLGGRIRWRFSTLSSIGGMLLT